VKNNIVVLRYSTHHGSFLFQLVVAVDHLRCAHVVVLHAVMRQASILLAWRQPYEVPWLSEYKVRLPCSSAAFITR
jgi:hypothetical protein